MRTDQPTKWLVPLQKLSFGGVSPYVCSYYFSKVWVAEWPPFGKNLLTRLTTCSLCIPTICNFNYFPF